MLMATLSACSRAVPKHLGYEVYIPRACSQYQHSRRGPRPSGQTVWRNGSHRCLIFLPIFSIDEIVSEIPQGHGFNPLLSSSLSFFPSFKRWETQLRSCLPDPDGGLAFLRDDCSCWEAGEAKL